MSPDKSPVPELGTVVHNLGGCGVVIALDQKPVVSLDHTLGPWTLHIISCMLQTLLFFQSQALQTEETKHQCKLQRPSFNLFQLLLCTNCSCVLAKICGY